MSTSGRKARVWSVQSHPLGFGRPVRAWRYAVPYHGAPGVVITGGASSWRTAMRRVELALTTVDEWEDDS